MGSEPFALGTAFTWTTLFWAALTGFSAFADSERGRRVVYLAGFAALLSLGVVCAAGVGYSDESQPPALLLGAAAVVACVLWLVRRWWVSALALWVGAAVALPTQMIAAVVFAAVPLAIAVTLAAVGARGRAGA